MFDNYEIGRKRGRPKKQKVEYEHVEIDFNDIAKLKTLEIDPKMLIQWESGLALDKLISYEGGVPTATNTMWVGDAGVGKTTVLLDLLSALQMKNPELKCLFISAEMQRKQMFKYTQRFPQFGIIETVFTSDYRQHNTKDVIEQLFNKGWDVVLIDSISPIIESVREDMDWQRKTAESWLIEVCEQNNKGWNEGEKFTTFLLIQQVTKSGMFVGSNKLKHLMDADAEIRRDTDGSTYIEFMKNRNGSVNEKLFFQITGTQIIYTNVVEEEIKEEESTENKEE